MPAPLTASALLGPGYVDVPTDVLSIGERIAKGDPTMGWRGDPALSLMFNPEARPGPTGEIRPFEVWGVDSHEQPYIVGSWRSVGPTIIADLVASDWQKGKRLLDDLERQRVAKRRPFEDARRDRQAEVADKLAWAVRRTFGHLDGAPHGGFFGQVGGGAR